jgi:hypothetical protein
MSILTSRPHRSAQDYTLQLAYIQQLTLLKPYGDGIMCEHFCRTFDVFLGIAKWT